MGATPRRSSDGAFLFITATLLLGWSLPSACALAVPTGLRVNRAMRATHSRRAVNRFIEEGRLVVNGAVATNPDSRLSPGDRVEFDGRSIAWEEEDLGPHLYLKFHKPAKVVTTNDARVENNIIDAMAGYDASGASRRVYPIGRLDSDSTGLILLTSDGSIVNPLLRAHEGKRKEYDVTTSPRATDAR